MIDKTCRQVSKLAAFLYASEKASRSLLWEESCKESVPISLSIAEDTSISFHKWTQFSGYTTDKNDLTISDERLTYRSGERLFASLQSFQCLTRGSTLHSSKKAFSLAF